MDAYSKFLTYPAKTDPPISIFEHGSNTLQVLMFFINQNKEKIQNENLIKLAALLHDVGKIEQDIKSDRWYHSKYSQKYLEEVLENKQFRLLLKQHAIAIPSDVELLLKICEEHHNPSPDLLARCKEALLVSVSDIIASSIESGFTGKIRDILNANLYTELNLTLINSLGFDLVPDIEICRLDFPSNFVEDVLLSQMIFNDIVGNFEQKGLKFLLQKNSSLWVVGDRTELVNFIEGYSVNPNLLFNISFDQKIYSTILANLPSAGSLQIDSLKYIIISESMAMQIAELLVTRRTVRTLLERYDISVEMMREDFNVNTLAEAIERIWRRIKPIIKNIAPAIDSNLPESPSQRVFEVINGKIGRREISLLNQSKKLLSTLDKKTAKDVEEFLKLFDASINSYRSVTNVLFEYLSMQKNIQEKEYDLEVKNYVLVNGQALTSLKKEKNKSLCPVCRKFEQEIQAQALITGNPKMDSIFQIYRGSRSNIKVCKFCFLSGYMDLPLSRIIKEGQSISKDKEYLIINTPLSEQTIKKLLDFLMREKTLEEIEQEELEAELNSEKDEEGEVFEIDLDFSEVFGCEGADTFAILGMSRKRLSSLNGFMLPSKNLFGNLIGLKVPLERLVGESKLSGAVKKELIKSTMYEFYQITSGSLHYGSMGNGFFSVYGTPVDLPSMKKAHVAYQISHKYARVGKYRQLDTGKFMLLLNDPRKAITLILRRQAREKHPLGEVKIKEVFNLVKELVNEDWKFELGLKITKVLVDNGFLPRARSFWKNNNEPFRGHELVKWLQSIKMIKDPDSARSWGTRLINGYKRENNSVPNTMVIQQILEMVDEIITTCEKNKYKLSDFARAVADMDYYLLFTYNQKVKQNEGSAD